MLYFDIGDSDLFEPIPLADTDPKRNEDVISLGSPKGQSNAMTFGYVSEYRQITLTDTPERESCVTFPVISHEAKTNSGSSGGPLLNTEPELVGVNYAGTVSDDYEFHHAYAIPIEKVKEFLANNGISL